MRIDFREKYGPSALVVGGAEGLGAAFARRLADVGVNLVLLDVQGEKLEMLSQDLQKEYAIEVQTVISDLAENDALEKVKTQMEDVEINLLIYNAVFSPIGEFAGFDKAVHEKMIEVNVRQPMLFTKYFGEVMCRRGKGGVVLLSSMASLQGTALVAHYAATKAYLRILAEGLWEEWKPKGVDVMACIAGATGTDNYWNTKPKREGLLIPPVQTPDDVAKEALKKLGTTPSFIPGKWNRFSLRLMRLFLNQKGAVNAVSQNLRKMYL